MVVVTGVATGNDRVEASDNHHARHRTSSPNVTRAAQTKAAQDEMGFGSGSFHHLRGQKPQPDTA